MAASPPSADQISRFRAGLEALTGGPPAALALAVSGGPDSLALLLLAQAAYPGAVRTATVDHGLRAEAAAEARFVASVCRDIGVPHAILTTKGTLQPERASVQARARETRYGLLAGWAASFGAPWLATAHHLDDQAETVLMRLNRAAGAGGLAGIRKARRIQPAGSAEPVFVVRPLLGWRRAELAALVEEAGIAAVDDPSNRSPDYDRTHFRRLLAEQPLLDPERLAASAANLADAEQALEWAAEREWEARHRAEGGVLRLDAEDLPAEILRRLVVRAVESVREGTGATGEWRRDKLPQLLDTVSRGGSATLAGTKVVGGPVWRFEPAPPRRQREETVLS